jgi:starch phosphorylase
LLSSASLQDMIRRHLETNPDLTNLPERSAVQLNDTHPALAIPELMRLLLDKHGFEWEEAWDLAQRVFAYTNHTLLPEALETWSADLLSELLPRHLQIIREIDRRFQEDLRRRYPGDDERIQRMAIVSAGDHPQVRMAHLCVLGSHTVNGVAALHTFLLKEGLLRDFCELTPEKFTNKTNGITPRRWLKQANPGLAALIDERIGSGWERDLERLRELEVLADDKQFQKEFGEVKLTNKRALAALIHREIGLSVDPASIFDIQIKRFHEYKRQLLLLLWVIHRALMLRRDPELDVPPRTVIFAGKAAPTYDRAKEVIALIHTLAESINNDSRVSPKLKVVFLPNYSVGMAEVLVPAADVSEQISTAGYEASGTGNMKLALNGAITLGTLDGANVEIREEVGADNVIIFGLEAHQVRARRELGYRPRDHVEVDPELRAVIDALNGSAFTPRDPGHYGGLVEDLLEHDTYMLLADFASYCEAQRRVDALFLERAAWTRKAVLNTARMGKFSSDRTIRDYAEGIWRLKPIPVSE